jgi:hypothetical protein
MPQPLGYFGFDYEEDIQVTDSQAKKLIIAVCNQSIATDIQIVGKKSMDRELFITMLQNPRAAKPVNSAQNQLPRSVEWATRKRLMVLTFNQHWRSIMNDIERLESTITGMQLGDITVRLIIAAICHNNIDGLVDHFSDKDAKIILQNHQKMILIFAQKLNPESVYSPSFTF